MKKALVKQWMCREIVTVTPETTLWDASRLMQEKRVRRLPVLEDGHLVGIMTRGDMRSANPSDAAVLDPWELNFQLSQLTVAEVMSSDPVAISSEATIDEAAWVMLEGKFSGLPVIDDDLELVGIITESDIFRLVVQTWGKADDQYITSIKQNQGRIRV